MKELFHLLLQTQLFSIVLQKFLSPRSARKEKFYSFALSATDYSRKTANFLTLT